MGCGGSAARVAIEAAPPVAPFKAGRLGVIRLDYDYPPAPGDIDCPQSYDYQVICTQTPAPPARTGSSASKRYRTRRHTARDARPQTACRSFNRTLSADTYIYRLAHQTRWCQASRSRSAKRMRSLPTSRRRSRSPSRGWCTKAWTASRATVRDRRTADPSHSISARC